MDREPEPEPESLLSAELSQSSLNVLFRLVLSDFLPLLKLQ